MKKTAAVLLITAALSASVATTQFAYAEETTTAEEASVNLSGSINEIQLESGNQSFVYVPQGEDIDVGHNATWKPIILVYNDTILDADAAQMLAEECGFAEIAEEEQCVIMFINPADESGWTENDCKSLLAAVGSTEFENAAYSDGTLLSYDAATGLNENGKLPGYTERVYVFANGEAADFVSEYILCGQEDTVHYMTGYYKPAAAFLSNVSEVPESLSTLLESTEMPVYLVNASSDVEDFFSGTNSDEHFASVQSENTEGFSPENVVDAWDSLVGNVRRCYDIVIDIPDYETNFDVENEIFTASTGAELEYYLYTPAAVAEQEDGTAPLVVAMHGNDNSALTMAVITEWPTLAEENGFLYMGLNHCESMTDEEIMEAVQSVIDNHPVIDTSKLYMTGFSNGSIHTLNIVSNEKYKNTFAAVAPMNACTTRDDYRGSEEAVGQLADGSIMPVIYFGATGSHILEMPNQPWSMLNIGEPADTLAYIFARNQVTDDYTNDTEAGFWGIKADSEEEVLSKYYQDENNKLVKDLISSYASEDGNVYTELVAVTSIHEYEDVNAETAWDFMSRFSRNEDGTIVLNEN
jgi:poly(3-hydroxybutyrate) depolymerase